MPPVIALIGRPNVGKSTLFNRLARRSKAITHDRPGVTRDRLEVRAFLDGREVTLVDTGGMVPDDPDRLGRMVMEQAQAAIGQAHLVLFVTDARDGLMALDHEVAEMLRQCAKPVLVAVNKADGEERAGELSAEFYSLGFPLVAVSAAHGRGISELQETIADLLPPEEDAREEDALRREDGEEASRPLRLAMLGRPNAGKSSLVNALVGETRLIVSEVPGTTRDAVDVAFTRAGKQYVFVDTAGVRKKARIDDELERHTATRALNIAKRANVAVLVIDAEGGVGTQDKKLIAFLDKEKTPFLVAINKIDLIPKDRMLGLKKDLSEELRICPHVPVLYVSAFRKKGLGQILETAEAIRVECAIRVGTGELNRVMRQVLDRHQPPMVKGRRAKFYYLTQTAAEPPTFVFFVNDIERVKPSYAKYVENQLRRLFGLTMAPLRILFRSSHTPKE
ncbi:ribosome biogenesis GTPase Der [Desulfolutivibrio sulfoxidireducens]|uniref:ribosome biogenesis GTPase Der n=1 Tax=Desulfolutivibrio sulfoxidireducens TaxID=2773299 RepID=UPI00159E7078|nr:ribosome biogenesis GTPase Der [Desulfolutivibrio sulfoxidireducens]QLA17009.1 ribosome biogenesis GTPase Der [Desulfolutivibrio sulfoxidireducens]